MLAGLVSRGVTRPIEALQRAPPATWPTAGGDVPADAATAAIEIRALYEDFRAMAEAIERRSRYLRDFAAAVSHEFKTPLAGIEGAVELLQDHDDDMSADERRRFLDNIAADADRLSQLVTRLLDLARADMARPRPASPLDLRPRRCAAIVDALAGGGFGVGVDLPEPACRRSPCPGDHGDRADHPAGEQPSGRRDQVAHRSPPRHEQTTSSLDVADDGPGVPEADRERLFEPFFTSRRGEGGTGLGLPIAQALLNANRASLALVGSQGGAAFELTLPRSGSN